MDCDADLQNIDGFHGWAMDPVMDANNTGQINSNIIQDVSELEGSMPFNFQIRRGGLMNNDPVAPNELGEHFKVRDVSQ